MIEVIWQKKLNEKFTLMELKESVTPRCWVHYGYENEEETFTFDSWGMDREQITVEDCLLCWQVMLCHDTNDSINSFGSSLEYARNEFCKEE